MSAFNKEFLAGLVESTNTIESENGYIVHPLLEHLPRLIEVTEKILAEKSDSSSFQVWEKLIKEPQIKEYLLEQYGDYGREPVMLLNTLNSDLLYGIADFLNRLGPILLNEQDFSLLSSLFKWLKFEVSINSGQDFLNLLKMAEICYPLLMFEKPVKEWVVDYRKIQADFLAAGKKVRKASEVGVFKELAEFLAMIKDQKQEQ